MLFVYIGLGGAIGAIMRFLVSNWTAEHFVSAIPIGTLTVNTVGSFLLGLLYTVGLQTNVSDGTKALLTVGFLGAFTTFSTFSNEILVLLEQGRIKYGLFYLFISIVVGLAAAALGHGTASFFLASSKQKEQSND
ncbi:fluoride efflux transporter CrcB [Metallumcola ferriviriculae]|uniref:Fluoride-specific ion channel FluC n=1 Tax=Metallumcola ferriviriculae TaxID=3039180 RepID=A0AAU0ULP1_9FIRM|nr:fluoride efflux transporter CrcB [Desulfitibacteraceae bacterium MK1]